MDPTAVQVNLVIVSLASGIVHVIALFVLERRKSPHRRKAVLWTVITLLSVLPAIGAVIPHVCRNHGVALMVCRNTWIVLIVSPFLLWPMTHLRALLLVIPGAGEAEPWDRLRKFERGSLYFLLVLGYLLVGYATALTVFLLLRPPV